MKKFYLSVLFVFVLVPAFSQFRVDGQTKSFFSLNLNYSFANYLYTGDNDTIKDEAFNIIGLTINHYKPLSPTVPVYLDWGMDLTFSSYKHVDHITFFSYPKDLKLEYLYFSWVLKGNLAYAVDIPNTSLTLMPYAGMFMRFHIGGKSYYTCPTVRNNTIYDTIIKTPLFTESNNNPEPWSRTEIGASIGAKLFLGDFGFGVEYAKTFTELTKDINVSEIKISAIFRFNN